jgi:predicted nuclease of predicted toxin-antitoxin system
MRFLLDQGTPRSTVFLLREAGFDAVHVGEIGMAAAEDDLILRRAATENRVVVTLDADFHALLALSNVGKPSVIRIRVEGLKAPDLNLLLQRVIAHCHAELETGALVSVEETRIRLRRLPIS